MQKISMEQAQSQLQEQLDERQQDQQWERLIAWCHDNVASFTPRVWVSLLYRMSDVSIPGLYWKNIVSISGPYREESDVWQGYQNHFHRAYAMSTLKNLGDVQETWSNDRIDDFQWCLNSLAESSRVNSRPYEEVQALMSSDGWVHLASRINQMNSNVHLMIADVAVLHNPKLLAKIGQGTSIIEVYNNPPDDQTKKHVATMMRAAVMTHVSEEHFSLFEKYVPTPFHTEVKRFLNSVRRKKKIDENHARVLDQLSVFLDAKTQDKLLARFPVNFPIMKANAQKRLLLSDPSIAKVLSGGAQKSKKM